VGCVRSVFVAWRVLCDPECGSEACIIAAAWLGVVFVLIVAVVVPSGEHVDTSLRACYYKHSTLEKRIKSTLGA
jgi:hypothetical protein